MEMEWISVKDRLPEPPEVIEMCPSCGKEVTLIWDTEKDGYKAFCPYCGERLMLCSACHDDDFACDYSKDTDSCQWNPAMKWQLSVDQELRPVRFDGDRAFFGGIVMMPKWWAEMPKVPEEG